MSRKIPEPVAVRRSKAPPPAAAKIAPSADVPMDADRQSQARKPDGTAAKERSPVSAVNEIPGNSSREDRIAARAYLKWLARGCPMGDDKRDWFEAQAEVLREQNQTT